MSAPLLELDGFCVSYGAVQAVHQVGLRVGEGEIVTVIGPNGAGKTTLLGAAMGLLPSQGSLTLAGERIARPTVEAMVARGVDEKSLLVPEVGHRHVGRGQPAAGRLFALAPGPARPEKPHAGGV